MAWGPAPGSRFRGVNRAYSSPALGAQRLRVLLPALRWERSGNASREDAGAAGQEGKVVTLGRVKGSPAPAVTSKGRVTRSASDRDLPCPAAGSRTGPSRAEGGTGLGSCRCRESWGGTPSRTWGGEEGASAWPPPHPPAPAPVRCRAVLRGHTGAPQPTHLSPPDSLVTVPSAPSSPTDGQMLALGTASTRSPGQAGLPAGCHPPALALVDSSGAQHTPLGGWAAALSRPWISPLA